MASQAPSNTSAGMKYSYIENPFEGNFNPGDPLGQKLFIEATTFDIKEADKISLSFENSSKVLALLNDLCNRFGWSKLVHKVPVNGNNLSLLRNHTLVSLDNVQAQARTYFAPVTHQTNPIDFKIDALDPDNDDAHKTCFYLRVKSNIIAKALYAHLSSASIKSLELEKSKFIWTDGDGNQKMDGPTIIKLILMKLAPSTVLGVQKLREKISSAKLKDFQYDVHAMLDSIQASYDEIISQGGSMDTFTTSVFESLLSGSDTIFNTWVTTQQNKYYEDSNSFKIENLFIGAKNQYTNLIATGQWRKTETFLAALATRIQNLEVTTNNKSHGNALNNSQSQPDNTIIPGTTVEKWRAVKTSDSVTKDGKTYYWCKHHVITGKYDGLYVTSHDEAHHEEWSAQKQQFRGSNRNKAAATPTNPPSRPTTTNQPAQSQNTSDNKKLALSDKMKSVLLTRTGMTEQELEQLFMGN
jgi:hypothetical protein